MYVPSSALQLAQPAVGLDHGFVAGGEAPHEHGSIVMDVFELPLAVAFLESRVEMVVLPARAPEPRLQIVAAVVHPYCPIRYSFVAVRMKRALSATAGDANMSSPRSFCAISL